MSTISTCIYTEGRAFMLYILSSAEALAVMARHVKHDDNKNKRSKRYTTVILCYKTLNKEHNKGLVSRLCIEIIVQILAILVLTMSNKQ